MGSVQQSSVKAEKQMIEKINNESEQEFGNVGNVRIRDITTSYILNQSLGLNLQLLKHHVWFGSVVGSYPPTIKRGATNGITSRSDPPGDATGSKIAVVYAGSNEDDGPNNCAWLLAWYAPADGITTKKVYVEAGDISKYADEIEWDEIESKLDASSNQSYYMDDDTGSEASAGIEEGYKTKISAVFDVANKK
ncbi:jasmonate-induced protein homolog [Beta vulgaris subsp. vulgaris]|uniref:jasmonate-induced protein homolog n=1 Tax=Beta vulgaris subsp. vulgaris TaxID=3555 RepID=UPI0020371891|nr:jasmonate-induced protein homolog [Beta vulgaris subsp. vulgaris]